MYINEKNNHFHWNTNSSHLRLTIYLHIYIYILGGSEIIWQELHIKFDILISAHQKTKKKIKMSTDTFI